MKMTPATLTRRILPTTFGVLAVLAGLILAAPGAQSQRSVDFGRDVWPILRDVCVTCHGPEDSFNDLRLDSQERILRGGKNGKILVPGDPERSPMYVRISLPADDLDIMPAEGDPLTKQQQEVIRLWIAQGAEFGDWVGPGAS